MDHPLDLLRHEHRIIEQVLACLEKATNRTETDGNLDVDSAREMIGFFRDFADGCHHAKEEDHLLPLMESKGFSPDHGPTAVMRSEHELGRELLNGMEQSIAAAGMGYLNAVKQFLEFSRRYISMLREHIEKEDHCLFPMAEQFLSQDDLHKLHLAFCGVESEAADNEKRQSCLKSAQHLAERYGVAPIASKDDVPNVACVHGVGKMN